MRLSDQYKEAEKDGRTEVISSIFKKEWKKNEEIIGVLVSVTPIHDTKFNKEYFSYLFHTDEGNIKTALGAGVDQEVRPFMTLGETYSVTFLRHEDIGKGSPMKVFRVVRVIPEGESSLSDVGQGELDVDRS